MTANRSFDRAFAVTPEQTTGLLISELGDGQWDIPALHKLLEGVFTHGAFNDYHVEHDFHSVGQRTMLLSGRELDGEALILLAFEDVTDRRRAEVETARLQQPWFETALGSIGDAVIATDADTRVQFMNPTAQTLTGWKLKDATSLPLDGLRILVVDDEAD